MKRAMILLSVFLPFLALGFFVSGTDAEAAGCLRCMPGGLTTSAWGMASTCAGARADAIDNATALIPASCDTCKVTPILVKDCYGSNPVKADYKVLYNCNEDLCW